MATKRNYVRTVLMAVAALIVVLVLAWIHRTVPAIRIGLASVSQVLCEEVYIAGLDPHRVYAEEVVPRPGLRPLLRHLRYQLDPARRSVQVNWTGHFNAIAQDLPGYGCRVVPALLPLTVTVPDAVPQHESPAVATIKPALSAALDRAFAEPAQAPYRQVRAIVVMHRGADYCRTLRTRHYARYAAAGLFGQQIGYQRAGRHTRATRQTAAGSTHRSGGMARRA